MNYLKFFTVVRPNTCKIVERLGRFQRQLQPGLHFAIPVIDLILPEISFKEETKTITGQEVITKDSIQLRIDGIIYYRVFDAYKITYSNTDPHKANEIMAQSLLRCEIGKLTLDSVLHERQRLNKLLQEEMRSAADRWGIECFRYEITNVNIDESFSHFMNMEAESERYRRKVQLDAKSIEVTAINNAQNERAVIINSKTAESQAVYYNYHAIRQKAEILEGLMKRNELDLDALQLKLKRDLIDAFTELNAGNKNIFMRADLSDLKSVLKDIL